MKALAALAATAGIALAHPELEERIDSYLRARNWSWQQLARGECVARDTRIDPLELQLYLINSDPALWAECNFHDREEGGGQPWRFFGYQKIGVRRFGNAVFKCAAEVGKTRDIVVLSSWLFFGHGPRQRGDILVAGALDANLDDIYDELIWQFEENPDLYDLVDWEKSKVKPYRKLVSKIGNRMYFRPAGHDGRAFRGVHVSLAGFFDEAALPEGSAGKRVWREFWRALKPWAIVRLYSVPTGVRETEFYRLGLRAQAVDPLEPVPVSHQLGIAVQDKDEASSKLAKRDRTYVLIRWPKTLMPEPFWSRERDLGYQEEYGGIDSSGYQQNVLGNDGDPTNTLFPWERLSSCLKYEPRYREVRLLLNQTDGLVHAHCYRLSPSYVVEAQPDADRTRSRHAAAADVDGEDDSLIDVGEPLAPIRIEEFEISNFDLRAFLRSIFTSLPGHLVAGVDFGFTEDPTEILLFEQRGTVLTCVARIHLRRFNEPQQLEVFRWVDEIFSPSLGWGLESTGRGTAMEHLLRSGLRDAKTDTTWSLDGNLTGYITNANIPDLSPVTGEPILDERTDKPRLVTTKEKGTQLLESAVADVDIELPPSPDFMTQFPNYRAVRTPNGRRLDNRNDHLVDATRVAKLRAFEMEHGVMARPPIFHQTHGQRRAVTREIF